MLINSGETITLTDVGQAAYLVDCAESSRADDLSATQLRLLAQPQVCHVRTRVAWRQILHGTHAAAADNHRSS